MLFVMRNTGKIKTHISNEIKAKINLFSVIHVSNMLNVYVLGCLLDAGTFSFFPFFLLLFISVNCSNIRVLDKYIAILYIHSYIYGYSRRFSPNIKIDIEKNSTPNISSFPKVRAVEISPKTVSMKLNDKYYF